MPEVTIVDSWRDMTARSLALTRFRNSRLTSLERYLAAMSTTTSPRSLSWLATSCLVSASTSPLAGMPARSMALKTKVAMAQAAIWWWALAAPASRRNSSGECARDSASCRVIFPLRTSCESAASIVCMPCAAPVCRTE